jgi:hypothetical protein
LQLNNTFIISKMTENIQPFPFRAPPQLPKKLILDIAVPLPKTKQGIPSKQRTRKRQDHTKVEQSSNKLMVSRHVENIRMPIKLDPIQRNKSSLVNDASMIFLKGADNVFSETSYSEPTTSRTEENQDVFVNYKKSFIIQPIGYNNDKDPLKMIRKRSHKNMRRYNAGYADMLDSLDKQINAGIKQLSKL